METRGQSYTIDKNNNSVKCVALTLIFIALEKMVLRSEVMPMNRVNRGQPLTLDILKD
jgi:hypothetical protein